MWLFAGFSTWLTEEAADGTDAFTLLFSFLPCCVPPPSPRSGFSLSIREEGEEEKGRRWVVLINGRKPDDGKGRCEIERPPLPTCLPTRTPQSLLSLSLSISSFSLSACSNTIQTQHIHTNMHVTTNMLQINKKRHSST